MKKWLKRWKDRVCSRSELSDTILSGNKLGGYNKKHMKKILIIEDDPFLGEMYAAKFTEDGFETEVAMDGKAGLVKIKESKPDLVLLDIVLPKMDGFEILKKIKGNSELKKIPVVLLTNLGQKAEVEKGLSLGADEYIIKAHFTPTAVVAKVKEMLSKKETRKTNGK